MAKEGSSPKLEPQNTQTFITGQFLPFFLPNGRRNALSFFFFILTIVAMKTIASQTLTGERAAFKVKDTHFSSCRFEDGESPIKESSNILVTASTFAYKYPLWYGKDLHVVSSALESTERAGVWYSKSVIFEDCIIDGPKNFRKCDGLIIKRSTFSDAQETPWWNRDVELDQVEIKNGAYFGMGSKNLKANKLVLQGNYAFDGSEDLLIENSTLETKDAFWNCKRVTLKNCSIIGEYFGWNSEDITLIHCHIESHQGFCYMKNVTLIDCEVVRSDLTFEYCSNINAEITSVVDSIKNPISGRIKAKGVEEIILDDESLDHSLAEIITQ